MLWWLFWWAQSHITVKRLRNSNHWISSKWQRHRKSSTISKVVPRKIPQNVHNSWNLCSHKRIRIYGIVSEAKTKFHLSFICRSGLSDIQMTIYLYLCFSHSQHCRPETSLTLKMNANIFQCINKFVDE